MPGRAPGDCWSQLQADAPAGPGNGAGREGGGCLTFVARRPGLVAVVAGDAQNPLDGREPHGPAGEVLHRARPFQILLNRLVHHQVFEPPSWG